MNSLLSTYIFAKNLLFLLKDLIIWFFKIFSQLKPMKYNLGSSLRYNLFGYNANLVISSHHIVVIKSWTSGTVQQEIPCIQREYQHYWTSCSTWFFSQKQLLKMNLLQLKMVWYYFLNRRGSVINKSILKRKFPVSQIKNIRKDFDTDINNIFQELFVLNFWMVSSFKCCLSSSVQVLFPLKVIARFYAKYKSELDPRPLPTSDMGLFVTIDIVAKSFILVLVEILNTSLPKQFQRNFQMASTTHFQTLCNKKTSKSKNLFWTTEG